MYARDLKLIKQYENEDVNAVDSEGNTPLHWAAQSGYLRMVKYLKNRGANVKARNSSGSTPLHTAACEGHLNILKYFLNISTSTTIF